MAVLASVVSKGVFILKVSLGGIKEEESFIRRGPPRSNTQVDLEETFTEDQRGRLLAVFVRVMVVVRKEQRRRVLSELYLQHVSALTPERTKKAGTFRNTKYKEQGHRINYFLHIHNILYSITGTL